MIKHLLLSALSLLLITTDLLAQCPTGDVDFESQDDINQFLLLYPNCTTINGDLSLSRNVTDLSGLSNLTTITGQLIADDSKIENFTGLNNLTSVGSLIILDNSSLISLSALSNVSPIDETQFTLSIEGNLYLETLLGLEGISGANTISIVNTYLLNLDGLNNLTTIHNKFDIFSNGNLQTLEALSNLEEVLGTGSVDAAGVLDIRHNFDLVNLQGLNNLKRVHILVLERNTTIQNLVGLENLTETQMIMIGSSSSLTSLNGIGNVTNLKNLVLVENEQLSICANAAVCSLLNGVIEPDAMILFSNNAEGCNSVQEISEACEALPVTLVDFMVTAEEMEILLSWTTSEEINTDYFEVEMSSDGKNWNPIGKISGQGTTYETNRYLFQLARPPFADVYFRLKMVDKDSSYDYSPIRSIQNKESPLFLFPNPVSDMVYIRGTDISHIEKYSVATQDGKVILESEDVEERSIDLKPLSAGVYFVTLKDKNGVSIVRRIFKK